MNALVPRTLTVSSTAQPQQLRQSLPFTAYAFQIDNYTNQWLFIDETGTFVGPYIVGRIVPVSGANTMTILVQAPVGYSQATIIPGQTAQIIPFDSLQAPVGGSYMPPGGAGTSLQPIEAQPAVTITGPPTTSTFLGATVSVWPVKDTTPFTPGDVAAGVQVKTSPPFMEGPLLVVAVAPGASVTTTQVINNASWATDDFLMRVPMFIPTNKALGLSSNSSTGQLVDQGLGQNTTGQVPWSMFIVDPSDPLARKAMVLLSGALEVDLSSLASGTVNAVGQQAMASSLPVAIASDQSAGWMDAPVPDKTWVVNVSLAAGATSTLLAASSLKRLYSLNWSADGTAATSRLIIGDTALASNYAFHSFTAASGDAGGQYAWGGRGMPAAGDRGIGIKNSGTAASPLWQVAGLGAST